MLFHVADAWCDGEVRHLLGAASHFRNEVCPVQEVRGTAFLRSIHGTIFLILSLLSMPSSIYMMMPPRHEPLHPCPMTAKCKTQAVSNMSLNTPRNGATALLRNTSERCTEAFGDRNGGFSLDAVS